MGRLPGRTSWAALILVALVGSAAAQHALTTHAASPAGKKCHTVTKKVHGKKKRVRVCEPAKSKPKKRNPSITIPGRPRPREEWFHGCPPWGHGGDPDMNLLKDRIDRATRPRTFTASQFLRLPWPAAVSRHALPMERWTRQERKQAFKYEGAAASLVGYLVAFNRIGPKESCNCGGKGGYDWHLWIGKSYKSARAASIITEATPRVRAREAGFNWKRFATLAGEAAKVRVTGWIFLDNDHGLGETDRATLWEIHPITRVDVLGKHGWQKVAG